MTNSTIGCRLQVAGTFNNKGHLLDAFSLITSSARATYIPATYNPPR
jgi:hypothetical protein